MNGKIDPISLIEQQNFDRKREIIKDEQNSIISKLNLLAISESMLIISFVTSLNLGVENRIVPVVLEAIGFVVTFVFFFSIVFQGVHISKLEDDFEKEFPDSKIKFHTFSLSLMGLMLVFVFLMMWGLFLIYLP